MRRVVITGIGAVTPVGLTFSETWETLKAGGSGIATCSRIPVDDLPWKTAGELKGFDALTFLSRKERNRLDPFVQYALSSALSAFEDASLRGIAESVRTAVIIGSSRGGISRIEDSMKAHFKEGKPLSPYLMPSTTISMAASYTAGRLGLKAYCLSLSNACASGAMAIGEAFRLIRTGYADLVLAGGSEAPICRVCFEGYGRTGALSRGTDHTASRPFDRNRDGFVLAEGASTLVIEELDQALRRGARPYAEILGYAAISGEFHQTSPSVSGEAMTIRLALRESGVTEEDIDMVNAHGTSTRSGDLAEARALKKVFGPRLTDIPVTANKSMTGHMLAASGALEVAVTAMSLQEGEIPPTINISVQDEECRLNLPPLLTKKELVTALSTSFGFGGVNAAIVLRKL